MGAQEFVETALGRTPSEAFSAAVAQAQYMCGHGGYTGTIAEKSDYVLFTQLPKTRRLLPAQVHNLVDDARYGDPAESKAAGDKLIHLFGYEQAVKLADCVDDKWGPAACVELTGKNAVKTKAFYGRAGTHDKVYSFFGIASS